MGRWKRKLGGHWQERKKTCFHSFLVLAVSVRIRNIAGFSNGEGNPGNKHHPLITISTASGGVLLSWCLFYCLGCFNNNWISSLFVKKAPFLETVLGRSDYFPCCPPPPGKVFYREAPGTQACSNHTEGRPPWEAFELQEVVIQGHTWGLLLPFLINATYSQEWRVGIGRGDLRKSQMRLSKWICISLRTSRTGVEKRIKRPLSQFQ